MDKLKNNSTVLHYAAKYKKTVSLGQHVLRTAKLTKIRGLYQEIIRTTPSNNVSPDFCNKYSLGTRSCYRRNVYRRKPTDGLCDRQKQVRGIIRLGIFEKPKIEDF